MVQEEAVFREELNIEVRIDVFAKSCLRCLHLVLVSGPVRVRWKYELTAKRWLPFSFPNIKVMKRSTATNCLNGALD